jgi:hypothetical protein
MGNCILKIKGNYLTPTHVIPEALFLFALSARVFGVLASSQCRERRLLPGDIE